MIPVRQIVVPLTSWAALCEPQVPNKLPLLVESKLAEDMGQKNGWLGSFHPNCSE
jgi:hypothetical protein